MGDQQRARRLEVNLREERPRAWRRLTQFRVVVLCALGLIGLSLGLDRMWPGAGKVMDLVVIWVFALGLLVVNVWGWWKGAWRELPAHWRVFLVVTTLWFLGRAVIETQEALR